jgi:hypothetical protein
MTEHLRLIARQLAHLQRMREYLNYSTQRAQRILPITNWRALSLEQHETLAAFRVRFSEFHEHLGKTMRAVAIEEEVEAERFGLVLAFMEKLGVLESAERWKLIRELRNAINHEYEEDADRLTQFFTEIVKATPELFGDHQRLLDFCAKAYSIKPQ